MPKLANLYTETRTKFDKEGLHYESLPDGRLFAHTEKKTLPSNMTKEDLPESFVHGRYYKHFGWLNAEGVEYLEYKPNLHVNHVLRDDNLYVSYKLPIIWDEETKYYTGYFVIVDGFDMIDFIEAVEKFSPACDTSKVKKGIIDKMEFYRENYPDELDCPSEEKVAELKERWGVE